MSDDFARRGGVPQPVNTRRELDDIRRMSRPGSLLGAWYERAKVRAAASHIRAQQDLVREIEGLLTALNDLDIAKLERGRTIRMLEDAESIYEADARKRREELDKAIDAQEDMATELKIRRLQRQRRLQEEQELHEQYMAQRAGGAPSAGQAAPGTGTPNQAQREFQADLDQAFDADRARLETEEHINEYVKRNGGWENLTEKQKETIERMRAKLEELIRESGRG